MRSLARLVQEMRLEDFFTMPLAARLRRERGWRERTKRSYFHRLCPAAPRKYSGAKYVNERNTSCKSEGTSKAKASYLQLDIVPVGTKKRPGIPREGKEGEGAGEALAQLLIRLGGSPRLKTSGRGFELCSRGLRKTVRRLRQREKY